MSNQTSPGAVPSPSNSRTVWLIGGVLLAAALSAGAGMLLRKSIPAPASQTVGADAAQSTAAQAAAAGKGTAVPATTVVAAKPAAAPTCHDCGVVESVRQVTHKGQASGVGAVAGGVLGGVVGNQVGRGNGRTAMTVLGAVGGGLAGNEIEKRTKSVTVHEVTVRMDDGSVRTIEQAQAPRTGERVIVQGKTLKPAPAAAAG